MRLGKLGLSTSTVEKATQRTAVFLRFTTIDMAGSIGASRGNKGKYSTGAQGTLRSRVIDNILDQNAGSRLSAFPPSR